MLKVRRLSSDAVVPTRATPESAGLDLYAAHDALIAPHKNCLIRTDIAIEVPAGTYGRIAGRSGLSLNNKLSVHAGVVDACYRGNAGIVLFNHAGEEFKVNKGDRVAQLILERVCIAIVTETTEMLAPTGRGVDGFGSSGIN